MGARPAKTAQSAAFGPAGRVRGAGDERVAGGAEAARPAGDAGAAGDERRGVPAEGDARGAGKAAPGAWDGGAAAFDDAGAPPPREVRARFARIEATEGAEAAVRYLYELERACGYLNEAAVARTIRWTSDAPCGPLEITINLAKPEKDPRAIAAAYRSAQTVCPDSPHGVLSAARLASGSPSAAAPPAGVSVAGAAALIASAASLGSSLEDAARATVLPASALPGAWRAGDLPAAAASANAAIAGASEAAASGSAPFAGVRLASSAPRHSLSSGPRRAVHEPLCDLCWENEGWPGSASRPAKPGLRIVPVELGGERWGLQFSPYAYFPEHCIALCAEHRPMRVDAAAVACLLDFADRFPFYFIGSNAGLPVVGGSILCHDHFQGGRYESPLMRASIAQELTLEGLPAVRAGVVDWPASVLRLASPDRASILAGAERVIAAWERFDDEPAGILSRTDAPHNAVSPILRRLPAAGGWARAGFAEAGVLAGRGAAACAIPVAGESLIGGVGALGGAPRVAASGPLPACDAGGPVRGAAPSLYVLDLVLRNNRTTPERPFGLFHPDESLFHIKRENIGLIEVMGRAILPPRLARELPVVQQALWDAALSGEAPAALQERLAADPLTAAHAPWAAAVLARRRADLAAEAAARAAAGCAGLDPIAPSPAGSAVEAAPACASSASGPLAPVVRDEVAQVFHQVLQATAVFKPDSAGRRARARFLATLKARPARS